MSLPHAAVNLPGTHTLYLDSFADTLELTHRAKNRRGLALGALQGRHMDTRQKRFL